MYTSEQQYFYFFVSSLRACLLLTRCLQREIDNYVHYLPCRKPSALLFTRVFCAGTVYELYWSYNKNVCFPTYNTCNLCFIVCLFGVLICFFFLFVTVSEQFWIAISGHFWCVLGLLFKIYLKQHISRISKRVFTLFDLMVICILHSVTVSPTGLQLLKR